ncbi:transmembrane channel-like protein 7 [Daktulosphaira vitifoliae]|uniref:transmembrane channel-like protein 7 n=1 Tax=Daktulosphaira vitifoliae TaxID=58002 RepID=UPI0021A9DF61|nr:transmembrane channel-like protein 7 [Daktulosphaira vitifoliae]
MSGGKKKTQCVEVWEEAGSEFYQESYPGMEVDLETFQKYPNKLSTLLPSNKTRTARKKINNDPNCYQAMSPLKPPPEFGGTLYPNTVGVNNDIQISLMPDLSENLSNEELIWEEIMKIKTLPISMAHKKELKAKLKSADAFRLQGFQRLRWQKRKMCLWMKTKWNKYCGMFNMWSSSLHKIEGHCGTGVVQLFVFIKLLIFINAITAAVVLAAVVVPSVYWSEWRTRPISNRTVDPWDECGSSNGSASIECCSAIYENATRTAAVAAGKGSARLTAQYVLDVVRGAGWVESTAAYYGYYSARQRFDVPPPPADRLFTYRAPMAYVCCTIFHLFITLVLLLRKSIGGLRQRMVETQCRYYLYANAVFSGWDFCINNQISAEFKRKAIANELRSYLASSSSAIRYRRRRNRQALDEDDEVAKRRITGAVVSTFTWSVAVGLIAAACYSVYLIFNYTVKSLQRREQPHTLLWTLLLEFATPVTITLYNVVLPVIFDVLARLENRPTVDDQDTRSSMLRILAVKVSLLAVLLGSVYRLINCVREKSQCASALCNSPLCWETYFGTLMYRLLIVDVAVKIGITVIISCPRSILVRHFKNNLFQAVCKQELTLAKHVLDVVYVQIIVWLGTFYAPMLPALGLVSLVIMFYIKRFSCVVNHSLAHKVYGPSRTHTAVMSVLLVSFSACAAIWATITTQITPSRSCGPFKGLPSVWAAIAELTDAVPPEVYEAVDVITSTNVMVPILITLLGVVYYHRCITDANKKMIVVLRKQLVLEGHDKQFLLNRLSAFLKKQDRKGRPITASDNITEIDVLIT